MSSQESPRLRHHLVPFRSNFFLMSQRGHRGPLSWWRCWFGVVGVVLARQCVHVLYCGSVAPCFCKLEVQMWHREESGCGVLVSYLKLENSKFILLGCKLPKQNMRCCSSSLHVASLWQWRGTRSVREWEE